MFTLGGHINGLALLLVLHFEVPDETRLPVCKVRIDVSRVGCHVRENTVEVGDQCIINLRAFGETHRVSLSMVAGRMSVAGFLPG